MNIKTKIMHNKSIFGIVFFALLFCVANGTSASVSISGMDSGTVTYYEGSPTPVSGTADISVTNDGGDSVDVQDITIQSNSAVYVSNSSGWTCNYTETSAAPYIEGETVCVPDSTITINSLQTITDILSVTFSYEDLSGVSNGPNSFLLEAEFSGAATVSGGAISNNRQWDIFVRGECECYEFGSAEANQPANTTLYFSDDHQETWDYVPVDDGNGMDCSVTNIKTIHNGTGHTVSESSIAEFTGTFSNAQSINDGGGAIVLNDVDVGTYTFGTQYQFNFGNDVAFDASGNIFITGQFGGTVDFDGTSGVDNHASGGGRDIFITKYNADNSYAWTRTFGSTSFDSGESIAIDASGNIFVTGTFRYTVDFDATAGVDNHTTGSWEDNTFITKYNADGSYGWTRTLVGTSGNRGTGISVNSSGDIFVAGHFANTVDFDGNAGTDSRTSTAWNDGFITKYNADGSYGWTRTFGGSVNDNARSVAVDASGDAYVTGQFENTVDFDGTGNTDYHVSNSNENIFITKYNADGSYGWTQTFGSSIDDRGQDIAIDGSGNIFVTGKFKGTANFDGTGGTDNHVSNGDYDVFVAKYNPSGSYGWTRTFGGTGIEDGRSIAIDASGSILTTGSFQNTVNFDATGTDNHTSSGGRDIFITKYNSSGSYDWTRTFGGAYDDSSQGATFEEGQGVAVDATGNVFVTGGFYDTANFNGVGGTDNHTASGYYDFFLTKYNTSGSYQVLASNYVSSGIYETQVNSQGALTQWGAFTPTQQTPVNTTISYEILDGSCSSTLISSTTSVPIDLSGIDVANTSLCVKAQLDTTNGSVTPQVDALSVSYTTDTGTEAEINFDSIINPTCGTVTAPTLTTAPTTSILDKTAQGNGNITDIGGEDPLRYIEWGTVSGTYTDSCSAGTGSTGVYSCTMTNLDPETLYYTRAYATNGGGTAYGTETSFTTLPLQDIIIPYPNPTKVSTRTSEGYMSVTQGTLNATTSTETNVNVTYRINSADVVFATGTTTTETTGDDAAPDADTLFDFEQFTMSDVTESVRATHEDSRTAFSIGVPGERLTFSQDVNVIVTVGGAFNGQDLEILYQDAGDPAWYPHDTCTVVSGECTFTTDHATIYTVNGEHSVTGQAPIDINVEVQDTLSLDCYDQAGASDDHTVTLGTAASPGLVTAGTPAVGRSTCEVTTNDDQGYYLTIVNSNPTYEVLTHTDPNTAAIYEITDALDDYEYGTAPGTTWSAPTTKGLAFSVVDFPDTDTANNDFDGVWNETDACPEGLTADTNDYAGIPDTAEAIAAVTQYEATTTVTDICYKVDVPPSQASGQYSGEVTYTATTDASSYHN